MYRVRLSILCADPHFMLFLEGQVLLPWNDEESTTRLSLYAVMKFWNDKHTFEQRILPSKVWHLNCFIVFASNNGIRAEIGLVGKVVCSLCEAGSKWIQPFFLAALNLFLAKRHPSLSYVT